MWMEALQKHTGKVCLRFEFCCLSHDPGPFNTRRDSMSEAGKHHKITYIEFPTTDIEQTTKFYGTVFGWTFQDWGPEYIGFAGAGMDGGFSKEEPHQIPGKFAPLVVLYSANLKATEDAVVAAGGSIVVPTFEFPGGRRFHFSDGVGNVLAVWSE
jgi:predicted enzyme related to lactoylglutathione lyase